MSGAIAITQIRPWAGTQFANASIVPDNASTDKQFTEVQTERLERLRIGAMLMVPLELGRGRRALMEVYRVRPQAFSRTEIERAQVVALQLGTVVARVAT